MRLKGLQSVRIAALFLFGLPMGLGPRYRGIEGIFFRRNKSAEASFGSSSPNAVNSPIPAIPLPSGAYPLCLFAQ